MSQLLFPGLSERVMQGIFERCDSSHRHKGECHSILKLDFGLIVYSFFQEIENDSSTLI